MLVVSQALIGGLVGLRLLSTDVDDQRPRAGLHQHLGVHVHVEVRAVPGPGEAGVGEGERKRRRKPETVAVTVWSCSYVDVCTQTNTKLS